MQHDEAKCKKCGGFVVGTDAIAAMSSGICSHCQNKNKRRKTEEQKRLEASHRAGNLAKRAMAHQAKLRSGGTKKR